MSTILKCTENLLLEMHTDKIVFSSDNPEESDKRDPKDIADVYEFIDRVRDDMSLTFAQKSQMIEDKINGRS
jgi:hypothetical protein